MEARVIAGRELTPELIARWSTIQEANASLASPFFRPEFTQAVARVREDAFVAVLDGGAAFFPYQRSRYGFGTPIGGPVSDYHGLISPSDCGWDAAELVRACGLMCWDFYHVPTDQTPFHPWRAQDRAALVIDLHSGARVGSKKLHAELNRRRRQLEQEFGAIEVELQASDSNLLRLCLAWKAAQYERTGHENLFAQRWAEALIEDLACGGTPAFSGVLSVLRAGGKPIAAHFGMRSRDVLHYWFPAYDTSYSRFSPGMLLLLAMISKSEELGLRSLDLGLAADRYKVRLATRSVPLMGGSVVPSRSLRVLRESGSSLLSWDRNLAVKKLIPSGARRKVRGLIGPSRTIIADGTSHED